MDISFNIVSLTILMSFWLLFIDYAYLLIEITTYTYYIKQSRTPPLSVCFYALSFQTMKWILM